MYGGHLSFTLVYGLILVLVLVVFAPMDQMRGRRRQRVEARLRAAELRLVMAQAMDIQQAIRSRLDADGVDHDADWTADILAQVQEALTLLSARRDGTAEEKVADLRRYGDWVQAFLAGCQGQPDSPELRDRIRRELRAFARQIAREELQAESE